jgi:hypothetical protein
MPMLGSSVKNLTAYSMVLRDLWFCQGTLSQSRKSPFCCFTSRSSWIRLHTHTEPPFASLL